MSSAQRAKARALPWEQAARWLACIAVASLVAASCTALHGYLSDYQRYWPDHAKYFTPSFLVLFLVPAGAYRLLPRRFRARQRPWIWLAFALGTQAVLTLSVGLRPRYFPDRITPQFFGFVADLLAPVIVTVAVGTLLEKAVIAWQERR